MHDPVVTTLMGGGAPQTRNMEGTGAGDGGYLLPKTLPERGPNVSFEEEDIPRELLADKATLG